MGRKTKMMRTPGWQQNSLGLWRHLQVVAILNERRAQGRAFKTNVMR
jgi:hypothetical protein